MMVVMTPAFAATEEEVMIEVLVARPLMVEVRVLTADVRSFPLTNRAVVVATLPLTTEVSMKELVDVETVSVFEVDDATRAVRSVVVATPLIVVVRRVPEVERALEEMTDDVAVIPLMTVVRVFPVRLWVKELMRVANVEETPLTIVWKKLAEEEAVLEVMILEVAEEPPRLEVRVLPEADKVLLVVRLVMVAFVAVRLVKTAVAAERAVVKKLVEVAFVNVEETVVRTVAKKLLAVVVARAVLPEKVLMPEKV